MIVVAVIGVLASIALPGYEEYIRRTHRAHARAALVQAAQWMERAATARGAYPTTAQIPAGVLLVEGRRYNVAANSNDGSTYTLTATPNGAQAVDPCASLRIDEVGRRSLTAANSVHPTLPIDTCWDR
jgi:type IV pilus assembly protein PilE